MYEDLADRLREVTDSDPSWAPHYLTVLRRDFPQVWEKVSSTAVDENAQRQVIKTAREGKMSHDVHQDLPGYSPDQILVEGCGECEQRRDWLDMGISSMDPARFSHAWSRAAAAHRGGIDDMSPTEARLLSVLWAVQVQLEARGFTIGIVPTGPSF